MDETPKGWYVQYIDRDPETIRRQEEQARKKKHDLDDEERSARFIEEQVRRGRDGKETGVSTGRTGFSFAHAQFIWIKVRIKMFCSVGNSSLHRAETGE